MGSQAAELSAEGTGQSILSSPSLAVLKLNQGLYSRHTRCLNLQYDMPSRVPLGESPKPSVPQCPRGESVNIGEALQSPGG